MPTFKFTSPDGKQYTVNGPDGATEQQAFQMLQSQLAAAKPAPPAKGFGEQLNDAIHDVPRQIGLTARYGLEGLGGTFDALVGNPLRTLAAPILGNKPTANTGKALADLAHLPEPENANERVVGDATRMLAGSAVPLGVASKAKAAADAVLASRAQQMLSGAAAPGRLANMTNSVANTVSQVAPVLAANPLQQLASAGAAGAAGGYTRETGGDATSQTLASLAAGIAAPAAMAGAQRAGVGLRQMMNRPEPTGTQIEIQINRAMQDSGVDFGKLAPSVQQGIRADVAQALKVSDNLDVDALRRLVDYRVTGATPTVGKLTRDPATYTQEENLMRVGANSKDKAAQQLGSIRNENNSRLIALMNETGANTSDDAIAGAEKVIGALKQRGARADQIISNLYDKARDSAGRSAALDHYAFTQRAGDLLHEANVESFLTPDIRNKLNGFASGEIPLTAEIAEQFKTGIGRIQRNSSDGNVRHALGLVRQALDETPLMGAAPTPINGGNQLVAAGGQLAEGQAPSLGQEAIDAFNKARRMNRSWRQIVERTPALQAVEDGVEPDKFVQQFIVGSGNKASVAGLAALRQSIKSSPEAMGAVRGQIARYLKSEALNGASDEVGTFSQSGFNKAFDAIGERKLRMFFTPEEIDRLKAVGRVAAYEQKDPVGSAVNRSNSAAGIYGILDRIISSPVLSKIPFARMAIQEPAENIVIGMQSKKALTAPNALPVGQRTREPLQLEGSGLMLSPALLMGGEDDEKR
jgi:hypothetical protein